MTKPRCVTKRQHHQQRLARSSFRSSQHLYCRKVFLLSSDWTRRRKRNWSVPSRPASVERPANGHLGWQPYWSVAKRSLQAMGSTIRLESAGTFCLDMENRHSQSFCYLCICRFFSNFARTSLLSKVLVVVLFVRCTARWSNRSISILLGLISTSE